MYLTGKPAHTHTQGVAYRETLARSLTVQSPHIRRLPLAGASAAAGLAHEEDGVVHLGRAAGHAAAGVLPRATSPCQTHHIHSTRVLLTAGCVSQGVSHRTNARSLAHRQDAEATSTGCCACVREAESHLANGASPSKIRRTYSTHSACIPRREISRSFAHQLFCARRCVRLAAGMPTAEEGAGRTRSPPCQIQMYTLCTRDESCREGGGATPRELLNGVRTMVGGVRDGVAWVSSIPIPIHAAQTLQLARSPQDTPHASWHG